jgi:cyclopropane-fatty-acyl-phospholipid synthase
VCDEWSQALLAEDDGSQPVRTVHDKETDAKAISYHYDLSNAFYQLWLDSDMAYSCAYFETGSETLEQPNKRNSAICAASCACNRAITCSMSAAVGAGWRGMRPVNSAPKCSASR